MTATRTRSLRRNQTEAERRLWYRLRNRQIAGHKFRRQVALGPYIVDFACFDERLIVELDGGQHGEVSRQRRDDERTAWLEANGYLVLRYWNNEVLENLDGVLAAIAEVLQHRSPHPAPSKLALLAKTAQPSPARGEGNVRKLNPTRS